MTELLLLIFVFVQALILLWALGGGLEVSVDRAVSDWPGKRIRRPDVMIESADGSWWKASCRDDFNEAEAFALALSGKSSYYLRRLRPESHPYTGRERWVITGEARRLESLSDYEIHRGKS